MPGVRSQHHKSWQLTARGTPSAPQILFPKLCLASSQTKTFGKLRCWKNRKKNHFTVSGDLGEHFKGFPLPLLCLRGVHQQLSPSVAGVAGISTAAESLPQAPSYPNTVWAGTTATTQQGLAELRLLQPPATACAVLEGEQRESSRYCTAQGQRGGSPGGTEAVIPCRSLLGVGSYHSCFKAVRGNLFLNMPTGLLLSQMRRLPASSAPCCSRWPGAWGTPWPLHRAAQVSLCTIPSVLRWNCTDTCFSSCEKAAELFLAWKANYKDVYYVLAVDGTTSVSSHLQHG